MAFGRELSKCNHELQTKEDACFRCGAKNTNNSPVKTLGFAHPIHVQMKKYLKQMRRRSSKIVQTQEISESTFNLLISICEKFTYTTETLALGLYIFQCLRDMSSYEKFWASCCLMVASKGIELDKNVPYLNRYQRYADKDHTQTQYQEGERMIFQAMNFDIQYSTFITFLNYYLTTGVIYEKDELNKSLVQYFEDDALLKAKQFLRKGTFTQFQQEKLALAIIKDTRKKYNLSQWNQQLTLLTGYRNQEISMLEEEKVLQSRKYDINHNSSHFCRTQKMVDLKNICIRKKFDEGSISKPLIRNSRASSSVKQNTVSTFQNSENSMNFSTKPKNNIMLAPISTQYLSNNSIFNLATKRR